MKNMIHNKLTFTRVYFLWRNVCESECSSGGLSLTALMRWQAIGTESERVWTLTSFSLISRIARKQTMYMWTACNYHDMIFELWLQMSSAVHTQNSVHDCLVGHLVSEINFYFYLHTKDEWLVIRADAIQKKKINEKKKIQWHQIQIKTNELTSLNEEYPMNGISEG